MIEDAQGNLLQADVEALVNTVNTVGYMGKGIALQFKQAFPQNFTAYAHAVRRSEVRPGQMLVVATGFVTNPRYIINFPTKRHWREGSRLEDIDSGLRAIVSEIRRLGIRSIAVPPLGCGNGGLDWSIVKPRIVNALGDVPEVRVLLYGPHGSPAPGDMPIRTKRPNLTAARALLLKRLWDSLSATPAQVPLTDPQRAELDRRLDVLEDDVEQGQVLGVPWDEVVRQIRKRG